MAAVSRLPLALVVLLAGCAGDRERLGPEWRPLRYLQEGGALAVGLGPADARTVGDTVHVAELEAFRARHADPVALAALLAHEQVHAARQEGDGWAWLARYLADRDFAWREEQLGWAAQVRYLREHGRDVDPRAVARALAGYWHPSGQLVSESAAFEWAQAAAR